MFYQLIISLIITFLFITTSWANEEIENGKKIYVKRCRVCHGENGDGKTFVRNALKVEPANFTDPAKKRELTIRRMRRSIFFGRPGTAMVSWKKELKDKDIAEVIFYIRTVLMGVENEKMEIVKIEIEKEKSDLSGILIKDTNLFSEGKKIYEARCFHCHGMKGDADMPVNEALAASPRKFTDPSIIDALGEEQMFYSIKDGIDGTAMIPWKSELGDSDINAVIYYIKNGLMLSVP